MVWLRKHPIVRAILGTSVALCVTLILVGGAFVLVMKGRDLRVPQIVQDRIAVEFKSLIPHVDIDFSDITVGLSDTWQPQFDFNQVSLSQNGNPAFVNLGAIKTQMALDDILRGDFRVSTLSIDGANIAVRRSETGEVTLRFGALNTDNTKSFDLLAVLDSIDTAANRVELSRFERFDLFGLTLQYDDMLSDQAFIVDGARFSLSRENNVILMRSDLALLNGGAGVSTLALNYKSAIGTRAAEFGVLLTDMPAETLASQSKVLEWLDPLQATISGALRSGLTDAGQLTQINGTLQISSGFVRPNDTVRPIPFDGAQTYFAFDPKNQEIRFTDISVKSRDVTVSATGYSTIRTDPSGNTQFTGQLQVSKLDANPFGLFPSPITTSKASADFRLSLDPFLVELPQIFIQDQRSQSHVIAQGDLRADAAGWNIGLSASVPRVSIDTVMGYWPEAFKDKPRTWVAQNIKEGVLEDVSFSMRAKNQERPEAAISFSFSDTSFLFMPDMPLVTGARGIFASQDYRTSVVLHAGQIAQDVSAPIDLAGTSFVIPDSRIKPSPAWTEVSAKGQIPDILKTLNNKPFIVLDRLKRDANFVSGFATATARADFILKQGLKPNEVSYRVMADLRDVTSDTLVPNRSLAANILALSIEKDVLSISGTASLNDVAGQGEFTAYLGPTYQDRAGELSVNATVGRDDLAALGISLPVWLVSGQTPVAFLAQFPKGVAPNYTATSSLVGAEVRVPQMSWSKPKSSKANFIAEGQFDGVNVLKRLEFSGAGASLSGKGAFQSNKFQKLVLDRIEIGPAFRGSLEIAQNGAIAVTGGRSDLSAFLKRFNAGSGTASSGGETKVRLDRLDVTDKVHVRNLDLSLNASNRGSFTGLVNGDAAISGRIGRQNGNMSVTITSRNAGKALVSAGVMKRASGGTLELGITGTGRSGEFDGVLSVRNVRIQNAPVLIELLNAISVVGLLDQLTGGGLVANEINAKFRSNAQQIIVENASMFGPSLGITVDGFYNKSNTSMDFQGVLSPLYVLNGIGSIFSKKGEGFIGFNFNIDGVADKPTVSVNPLSIFTPAMFRDIFRRPPPKLE